MKSLILSAAIVAIAAPAFANAQLAGRIGVEPGVYSDAQLAQIVATYDSENGTYVFPTENGTGDATAALAQLGAVIGQDVSGASVAEVATVFSSKDSENSTYGRIGGSDDVRSTRGGIPSGHAQLAAFLGVNPADYSVSELVGLKAAVDERNED